MAIGPSENYLFGIFRGSYVNLIGCKIQKLGILSNLLKINLSILLSRRTTTTINRHKV